MKKRSIYLTEEMDREIRILAAKTDKHYSDVVKEALRFIWIRLRRRKNDCNPTIVCAEIMRRY